MSSNKLELRILTALNSKTHIDENDIAELKGELDLVQIISKEGIELSKNGARYTGLCPFHNEKTPSFSVNQSQQFYHCFGCGANGDIFTFMMKYNDMSFIEAIKKITTKYLNKFNIPNIHKKTSHKNKSHMTSENNISEEENEKIRLEFNLESELMPIYKKLLSQTQEFFLEQLATNTKQKAYQARKYLKGKKIGNNIIKKAGIGFSPDNQTNLFLIKRMLKKEGMDEYETMETLYRCGLIDKKGHSFHSGRLTFPISTYDGQVVGFNARVTNGSKEKKYKNSPLNEIFSKMHILYGLENLNLETVRKYGLVLVEGITDTFGFLKQDLNNALVLGSSSLTGQQISIIKELDPKHIYFIQDGDSAGVRGAINNANKLIGCQSWSSKQLFQKEQISIVPILNNDDDPFDLFYSQEVDAKKYIAQYKMSPKDFLLSRSPKEIYFCGHQNAKMESFLANNTANILPLNELHSMGIYINETQIKSNLKIENVHPFILNL